MKESSNDNIPANSNARSNSRIKRLQAFFQPPGITEADCTFGAHVKTVHLAADAGLQHTINHWQKIRGEGSLNAALVLGVFSAIQAKVRGVDTQPEPGRYRTANGTIVSSNKSKWSGVADHATALERFLDLAEETRRAYAIHRRELTEKGMRLGNDGQAARVEYATRTRVGCSTRPKLLPQSPDTGSGLYKP